MTGKILVVDPIPANRIVLKAKLTTAFYQAEIARCAAESHELVAKEQPDLIILSDRLTDATVSALCSDLRRGKASDIPILVLTDQSCVVSCAQVLMAGADDVMPRTTGDRALFARIRLMLAQLTERRAIAKRLTRAAATEALRITWGQERQGSIGLISNDKGQIANWQTALLARGGAARMRLLEPRAAIGNLREHDPFDLFVVEAETAASEGHLDLLNDLGTRDHSRHAARLLMLPPGAIEDAATAFELGVEGVMFGHFDAIEISARLEALLRRKRQLDRLRKALDLGFQLSLLDPLTGLQNRRAAMDRLGLQNDTGRTRCLIMIDIDHFKRINDAHGHATGDEVLAAVAHQLRQSLSRAFVLARIGGEEFLAAFDESDLSRIRIVTETARRDIENLRLQSADGTASIQVTISAGIATCTPGQSWRAAITQADGALYQSKHLGRNRVSYVEKQAA